MVFIFNVNFAETRLVKKCLESFYGVGNHQSSRLLAKYLIFPRAKVGSLQPATINALTAELSNMTIENDLRKRLRENLRRLKDMGTLRGRRHAMGLPVRGQTTRTQVYTARKLNKIERRG